MNWVDKSIMLTLTLWVMKCQLSCWGLTRQLAKLEYKLQDLKYNPYLLREEYRDAYPEVPAVYRENDVPDTGNAGELYGTGPAVGDEAQDSASTESSVQGSTGPESRDS